MTKRIYKQSIILLLVAAVLSSFYNWKEMPLSIFIGGAISLLNFKGLSWGVHGFLATGGAKGKLIFLSFLRLMGIFATLVFIIYFRLVNVIGLLAGFTTVFIIIVKESYLYTSRNS